MTWEIVKGTIPYWLVMGLCFCVASVLAVITTFWVVAFLVVAWPILLFLGVVAVVVTSLIWFVANYGR